MMNCSLPLRILMLYPFSMKPRLASDLRSEIGDGFDDAFDYLIKDKLLIPVYPEAKQGDTGRQFWAVRGYEHLGPDD